MRRMHTQALFGAQQQQQQQQALAPQQDTEELLQGFEELLQVRLSGGGRLGVAWLPGFAWVRGLLCLAWAKGATADDAGLVGLNLKLAAGRSVKAVACAAAANAGWAAAPIQSASWRSRLPSSSAAATTAVTLARQQLTLHLVYVDAGL